MEEAGTTDLNRPSRRGGKMGSSGRNRSRSRSSHRESGRSRQNNVNNGKNNSTSGTNMFSNLQNNVSEHELINVNNPNNSHANNFPQYANKSVKKLPPITVDGQSVASLQLIISKIPYITQQPIIKITSQGHKIFARNVSDFDKIINYFKDKRIAGYTHPLEPKLKFCIYGLHKVDEDELKEELKRLNVPPVHVFSLPIRERKYDDHYVYVVHYMKSSGVTLNHLKLIRGIFNISIRWDIFSPFKSKNPDEPKSPTQCSNCQSFRHGTASCFRPPRCIRCSGKHKSRECPHLIVKNNLGEVVEIKERISDDLVKCANCDQKHTANFRGCKVRQEIMQSRMQSRSQSHHQNPHQQTSHYQHMSRPPPINDQRHFPLPPPLANPIGNNSWRQSTATSSSSTSQNRNDDLFSYDECKDIMREFVIRLSECRSKLDQLEVIGEITFKFLSYRRND